MEFETLKGKWFINDKNIHSENTQLGTGDLHFDKENEIFVLDIIFDDSSQNGMTSDLIRIDCIYGICQGCCLALINCGRSYFKISNIASIKYVSNLVITGSILDILDKIKNINDLNLDFVKFRLHDEMVRQIGFTNGLNFLNDDGNIEHFCNFDLDKQNIVIKKPEKINKTILNCINIYNDLYGNYGFNNNYISLQQSIYFEIKNNEDQNILDLINKKIIPIKNYFTFLIGANAGDIILNSKIDEQPITIYFSHILFNSKNTKYKLLPNIDTIFEDLETWITNTNKDPLFIFQFFHLLYYSPIANIYVHFKELCSLLEKSEVLLKIETNEKIYLIKALENKFEKIKQLVKDNSDKYNSLKKFELDNYATVKYGKDNKYKTSKNIKFIHDLRNSLTHFQLNFEYTSEVDKNIIEYSDYLEKMLKLFILVVNFKNENIIKYLLYFIINGY